MSENARGAIAMMIAMLCFTSNDALMKTVFATHPVGQSMFVRGVIGLVVSLVVAWRLGALARIADVARGVVALRSLFDSIAAVCFLMALVNMPLGALTATIQATPLIATAMAALILREPVGWRRWMATFVGLLGVLIIINPGGGTFDQLSGALLGLAAAFLAAARDLTTRFAPKAIPTILIAVAGVLGNTLVGMLMGVGEDWKPMGWDELAPIAAAAFGVVGGHYFVSQAMRQGEVSVIAPFRYSLVLSAIASAWVVLGEIPEPRALLGAAIVIAAGLYTLRREKARKTRVTTKAGLRGGV